LKPFQDAILEHLDLEGSKYFAIAHAGIWAENDFFSEQPILAEAKLLSEAAAWKGILMIGHYGIDVHGRSESYATRVDQVALQEFRLVSTIW
jgi:hypothetical protein